MVGRTLSVTGNTTLSGPLTGSSTSSDSFYGSILELALTVTGSGGSVITLPTSYSAVPGANCLGYVTFCYSVNKFNHFAMVLANSSRVSYIFIS